MYSLSLDQGLVSIYLIFILVLGFYKKSDKNTNNYLFAGRTLSLPSLVATIVCTWYGGILEIGRFTYENGVVTWIIFGLFYYIAALLFAVYIAPKIIESNKSSIPELFYSHYGKKAAIVATLCIILLTNPAAYLKILSTILLYIWDLSMLNALVLGASISLLYTFTGGFQSVIRTDKIQFIFLFLILLTFFFYLFLISPENFNFKFIEQNKLELMSLNNINNFTAGFIFFIALSATNLFHQGNWQKVYAAHNYKV